MCQYKYLREKKCYICRIVETRVTDVAAKSEREFTRFDEAVVEESVRFAEVQHKIIVIEA